MEKNELLFLFKRNYGKLKKKKNYDQDKKKKMKKLKNFTTFRSSKINFQKKKSNNK